jgi:histone H3/H4
MKKREFSLYDIEQFLRDAGAERVNEKAVISLENELEDTVRVLVENASVYASYAGRKRLINNSDVNLAINRESDNDRVHASLRAHAVNRRPKRLHSQNRTRMQRLSVLAQAHMLEQ